MKKYSIGQFAKKFYGEITNRERIVIGYCRVLSAKQKEALERQVENVRTYLISKGYQFEIITDIGSGINYDKKGLNQLIQMITVFSCRLQGKRAKKTKAMIKELIEND